MNAKEIVKKLKKHSDPKNIEGMARFGISSKNTLGVSIPILRGMAKTIGRDHNLALQLWKTGIHEARILAGMIDDPALVTEKQMEIWVKDFDSWDTCDQVCMNLFDKTTFAYKKAVEWTKRKEEFVKRAGFAMIAALASHDKKAKDNDFERLFPYIIKCSTDDRNFVRKAVNWALRGIGKRNKALNKAAIKVSETIMKIESKTARWIAGDALRELKSGAVKKRLKGK